MEIFRKTIADMEDALSARLALGRLDSGALLTYLHTCITRLRHPMWVPRIPMYLDAVLASQDLYGGFQPCLGELHLRVIGITGFPVESTPEMLPFLHRLRGQRCNAAAHKLSNLERKAPKHALADIRDDFHRIVYASSIDVARTAFTAFERTWAKRSPGVVTSLREGGDELLTFFTFPKT